MFRKNVLGLLLLVAGYGVAAGQSAIPWPKITRDAKPWVRWWWLGNAVDTPGLQYNLRSFQQAGIGGVEITPIYGVKGYEDEFIDYLSPAWMRMLHYTIAESRRLDMGVDMNNGTGWPFGGPQINIKEAASRAIFQTYSLKKGERLQELLKVREPKEKDIAPLCVLMAYGGNGEIIDLTRKVNINGKLNWTAPSGNWTLIALFDGKTLQKVKRASPGGEGWVMDPFSVKALQQYLARFNTAFSQSKCPAPHAFFNDSYEVFGAGWSPGFLSEFVKRRGYRLQDYLPALMGYGNKDTVTRVIADYRETLADMLLNNFAVNWTGWVHRMGSITRYQAHGSPGNLLDLYGSADIPEIESYGSSHFDIPGLPEDSLVDKPGKLDPLLLKFASSAAHVTGKKFTSSETFTWLGEHFRTSLSQCKPVLDEMWLSGINHVFFHGSPYSPENAPWPGWQFYAAVDFSRYNTIWHDIPAFNQYIARTQSFLQQGTPDNDVLVYWPVQDVWAMHGRTALYQLTVGDAVQWLSPTPFHALCETLMKDGYGFDYISDRQLSKISTTGGRLHTAGAAYKALVVPPCQYIPLKTLQQILTLARSGATVIFADSLPRDVPGLYHLTARRKQFQNIAAAISKEPVFLGNDKKTMGKGMVLTGNDISELMRMASVQPEGFADAGLQYIRRKTPDGNIYFIGNLGSGKADQWISLAATAGSAVIYDTYTGADGMAALRKQNGRSQVYLQLKPGQSLLLKTYTNKKLTGLAWRYDEPAGNPLALKGSWTVSFEKGMPEINKQYKMDTLASWTALSDSAKVFAGTAKYSLSFDLPRKKAEDWLLSLGEVDFSADIKINGKTTGSLWAVPFEIAAGKYLHPGKNTLEVEVTNLAANRIADYDRKGINWKIFYEINFVNMAYKPFNASNWNPVPSGLIGPVTLTPLRKKF